MKSKKTFFWFFLFLAVTANVLVSNRANAQQHCDGYCNTIHFLEQRNKTLESVINFQKEEVDIKVKRIKEIRKELNDIRYFLRVASTFTHNITKIITSPFSCATLCGELFEAPALYASCVGLCTAKKWKSAAEALSDLKKKVADRKRRVKELEEELAQIKDLPDSITKNIINPKQAQLKKNEKDIDDARVFVRDNCPDDCQNCNVATSFPKINFDLKPFQSVYCPDGPAFEWYVKDACDLRETIVSIKRNGIFFRQFYENVGTYLFGSESGSYNFTIHAENVVGNIQDAYGDFNIDCSGGADFCGNGFCGPAETKESCPIDCNTVPCGNGVCEPNETPTNCSVDCDFVPVACGNHVCENDEPITCPSDCGGPCPTCPCLICGSLPPEDDSDQDGISSDAETNAGYDPNNPNDPANSDFAPPDVAFKSPSKVCTSNCTDENMPWFNGDVPIIYIPTDDTDPNPKVVEGPASGTIFTGEGRYNIRIRVKDWLGKERVKDVAFGIDKTKPTITPGSSTAQPGSIVNGNVTIAPDVSDALSGVKDGSVVILLDGQQVSAGTNLNLPDGDHTVKVIACDRAGNCQEISWSFTIDTTPPAVAIEGVEEGAKYYCPQKATYSVSDANLDKVYATSSGTPPAETDVTKTSGEFSFEKAGSHNVSVTADDKAKNETTKRVNFKIFAPDFSVSVSPPYQKFNSAGEEHKHTVYISNRGQGEATFCISFKEVRKSKSIGISEVGPCVKIAGGATGSTYFKSKATQIIPDDKLINKVLASIQGCEAFSGDWLLGRGGAPEVTDHPDDIQDVSSIRPGTLGTISADAKTLVMMTGYFDGMGSFMQKLNEPVNILLDDFTLLEPSKAVKDYPILILPSGALQGLETSETVKALLDDYVKSGGVLIAFSQQRGYEFAALPGGKLSGYGWREDQSCLTNAAYIAEPHPIFSRQTKVNMDANVDGYFTVWPEDAKILLRRIKNNMPAMVLYKHGQGYVLATTMYPDFGLLSGQTTNDELNIVRDILTWANNPKDYPEAKPGEQISVLLNIVNSTTQDANAVKLTVRDSGSVVREDTVSVSVPAGQTVHYTYIFTAPATLGIYAVHYALLFDTTTVQDSAYAENVSVSQHLSVSEPVPGLQFSVTSPGENFVKDQPVTFTVHVFNNGDTDRNVTLQDAGHVCRYRSIGTFNVPAHSELSVPYTTSCIYFQFAGQNRWDFYILAYDAQTGQSLAGWWQIGVAGTWVEPQVGMALNTDKKAYAPGTVVNTTLTLSNSKNVPFDTTVKLSVVDVNNVKLYETTKAYTLSANQTQTDTFSLTLPQTIKVGVNIITAEASHDGQRVGSATAYFEVPKAKVAMTAVLPTQIVPSTENPISIQLTNTGQRDVSSGSFNLILKDPDGTSVFTQSQPFTLSVAEQKTLSFSVPFPALQFGTYKLSYSATTETGIILGSSSINAQPLFTLTPDKPSYKAGDTAALTLKVTNPDIFEMNFPVTLSAPSVSFSQTQNVTLSAKEQKTLTFSMPITNTASAGTNPLTLTVALTKPYTQNFSFFVLPARFTATLDKLEYQLNDVGNLTVTNVGGLEANASYTLSLTDKDGVVVHNSSGSKTLPVSGSTQIPVSFTNAEILSGLYRVSLLVKDTKSSVKFPFEQYVTFSGVSVSVSVSPSKPVYTSAETPAMKTKITPTGNLNNAKLTVKILNPTPGFTLNTQIGASASILVDSPYVYFGTVYDGLKRQDTRTKEVTSFLPGTYIYALAADSAYVYLGTKDALYRYDKASTQMQSFPVTNIRAFSNNGSFLWVGTLVKSGFEESVK